LELGYSQDQVQDRHAGNETFPDKCEVGYNHFGIAWWGTTVDLSTLPKKAKSRSFIEAKSFVHTLKLASSSAWRDYCASGKRPPDIPSNPQVTYRHDWQGWGDWLGTGRSRNVVQSARYKFRPFASARDFVRDLGFTGTGQWRLYAASANRLSHR
jgi:hypothetical protein